MFSKWIDESEFDGKKDKDKQNNNGNLVSLYSR